MTNFKQSTSLPCLITINCQCPLSNSLFLTSNRKNIHRWPWGLPWWKYNPFPYMRNENIKLQQWTEFYTSQRPITSLSIYKNIVRQFGKLNSMNTGSPHRLVTYQKKMLMSCIYKYHLFTRYQTLSKTWIKQICLNKVQIKKPLKQTRNINHQWLYKIDLTFHLHSFTHT